MIAPLIARRIGPATLSVVQADIVTLDVDAVVNAANSALAGGGGVDGAIHRAAGPRLVEASRALAPCPAGEARLTPGFDLKARFVIHAVGPVWRGGEAGEDALLADCYARSCEIAARESLRSIAFPAISTGVYRFPPERAARIAVRTVVRLAAVAPPCDIVFCCFSEDSARLHMAELGALADLP